MGDPVNQPVRRPVTVTSKEKPGFCQKPGFSTDLGCG
jgi:hypothetical protein